MIWVKKLIILWDYSLRKSPAGSRKHDSTFPQKAVDIPYPGYYFLLGIRLLDYFLRVPETTLEVIPPFPGKCCLQTRYSTSSGNIEYKNIISERPVLGLPQDFIVYRSATWSVRTLCIVRLLPAYG